MKKTLTNLEVANIIAYSNTEDSIAQNIAIKFPMSFAWKFRKNLNRLKTVNDNFAQRQQEIISFYSDDTYSYVNDKENSSRIVKDEYVEEYNKKLSDLYAQSTDLDIDQVKLSELLAAKIELSIPELDILSFMIDEENE